SAFSATVTAQDQFNNTGTGYTGTIHFTSSDPAAVVPADYSFVGGDNGVHTFTGGVTFKTAGSRTLTATQTGGGPQPTGTSAAVNVAAAGIDHFAVSTTASNPQTAGSAFSATVTAQD